MESRYKGGRVISGESILTIEGLDSMFFTEEEFINKGYKKITYINTPNIIETGKHLGQRLVTETDTEVTMEFILEDII